MASKYTSFYFLDSSFTINHKRESFRKREGAKSFPKKAEKVSCDDDVGVAFFTNFVQSIPFFNNLGRCRAEWAYTKAGYLPVKITTISPDGCTKLVDRFSFEG